MADAAVQAATTQEDIDAIVSLFFSNLASALSLYAEAKTEFLGTLGAKQDGPALIVTDKDGKEVKLYSPKSVEYIKVKE